jgi:hypothetical protein
MEAVVLLLYSAVIQKRSRHELLPQKDESFKYLERRAILDLEGPHPHGKVSLFVGQHTESKSGADDVVDSRGYEPFRTGRRC